MNRRLWFVNRFYWPDEPATAQLLVDLTEALAAKGWLVGVVTSHPGLPEVPPREVRHGVAICRLRTMRRGESRLGGRFLDYLSFWIGAIWQCFRFARRGDIIVAMTDPPLIGTGLWLVAALRRTQLLHWTQDIYPEVAMALMPHPSLRRLSGLLRGPRNFAWRHSAGCVTLGRDMAALIAANGISPGKIHSIPNWAPEGLKPAAREDIAALRAEWNLTGKFVVAYSGNLGRVHDLEPVIEVAEALRNEPDIAFAFIGNGPRRTALESLVRSRQLANIHFLPAQPRARLSATLGTGDVHLVTLRPGCETTVFPSKLYGIAAIGKPVVFIGPRNCELAALVREQGLGLAFERSEIASIASGLRDLKNTPGKQQACAQAASRFHRTDGSLKCAAERWDALLESFVRSSDLPGNRL